MMWSFFTYSDECLSRARSSSSDDADHYCWLAVHIFGFDFALTPEPAAMIIKLFSSSVILDMARVLMGDMYSST